MEYNYEKVEYDKVEITKLDPTDGPKLKMKQI